MKFLVTPLHHTLIVSCQAEEGFPLNKPEHLAALAATAVIGGASAIRASEPENIRAIKQVVDVPIIGIYKKRYPDSEVYITPTIAEVAVIADAGSDIIALDATARPRPGGQSLAELIKEIRASFDVAIMADISTFAEGVAAANLGVDIVATTMSGYTPYSPQQSGPDLPLIRGLAAAIETPIIAEGRINTPADARAALEAGAFAVVVGSAITRPHLITQRFVAATKPRPPAPTVYAIDIGGTKIAGATVDGAGQIVVEEMLATPAREGGMAVIEAVCQLIATLHARHTGDAPTAVGISTGGQVDAQGNIIHATELIANWRGAPLRATVAQRTELPVHMLNDGHAAALAEATFGAGRGYDSVLCVVIGTGLGGGLVVNGQVQHGAHGLLASVGQLQVTRNGRDYAVLEKYVSGLGLVRLYNERVAEHEHASMGEEVAERAAAGDEAAQRAIEEMGELLGLGLSHALHMVDASVVVIGGSVAQIGDLLLASVRKGLRRYGYSTAATTPILPAHFGAQAGIMGAAAQGGAVRRAK